MNTRKGEKDNENKNPLTSYLQGYPGRYSGCDGAIESGQTELSRKVCPYFRSNQDKL